MSCQTPGWWFSHVMDSRNQQSTQDDGPELLRDIWALTAVAILILALRIVAKIRIRKVGGDDLLMVFAMCLALVGSIIITVGVHYGFGQPVIELNGNNVPKIILLDYLGQTFAVAGGALGRISFIIFVLGLLTSRLWHDIVLWILIALQTVVNAILIIILFIQCPGHQSAIWENSNKEKCWNTQVQADYGYFQGAFNSVTDLYLASFSTSVFWRLNLQLRVRLGLVALLSLGIFAMVAAIIKTIQTRILATPNPDPTSATIDYDRWLFIETYLVIITASIPSLRSLFKSGNAGSQVSTSRNEHELHSRYAAGSGGSRSRRWDSSNEGKSIVNTAQEDASQDDIWRADQEGTCASRCSRESVVNCV